LLKKNLFCTIFNQITMSRLQKTFLTLLIALTAITIIANAENVAIIHLGTPPASCTDTDSTYTLTVCDSLVSPSGNYTWTTTGTYYDTIPNAAGCDSAMVFNLTVQDIINPTVITKNVTAYLDSNGVVTVYPTAIDDGSSDNCSIESICFRLGTVDTTGTICGTVSENSSLTMTAPAGSVFTSIDFASYGTPTGSCDSFTTSTCHASNSQTILDSAALGRDSFTINAGNGLFGDPCFGTYKLLKVQATYRTAVDSISFDCNDVGNNVVNLMVTDKHGNSALGSATITVLDTLAPTVATQNKTVYLDSNGAASITAAQINNGSSDACGIDTMYLDIYDFNCANAGTNTVTLTVVDIYGNTDSATAIVTVVKNETFDTISPVALNTYTAPSGVVKTVSEVFNDTIPNAVGCDSIITINLTVKYNPIYVDTSTAGAGLGNSWTNPFKTLQDAFDYAMANEVDTVFVAEGNYCPEASPFGGTNPKDFAFYLADSNVVVLGGYDPSTGLAGNPTVLCAAILGTDTSHHVLLTGGLDTNSRFENLTITGGRAGGNSSQVKDGRTYYSYFGGGVYNNLSSPIYKNVTITGNQSEKNGGGMYNYTSAPCLENTTIENNTAGYDGGGLYNIAGSSPKLQNVTIQGNTATNNGGGVFNVSSCNPKLNTVVLKSNSAGVRGGGIYSRSSSSAVMNGVALDSNTAGYYGGGMFNWEYSSPTVNNVSFSNNTAQTGAAIYNFFQSSPTLVGATFYKNTASTSGGAMYNSSSMPTIKNSLFFANSDDIVNTSSMVFGSYNASDKGTSSKANVGSGFVNLTGQAAKDVFKDSADLDGADNVWMTTDDGLMAKLCNSAIDEGSNSNIPSTVTTDITGASRIAGSKVDMGAYESVYNNDFSLPTTAGTYTSNKTFTNGSWVYYCDCSTQRVLLALDTTGSGAVVPNTGVGLKIGNYPTISWPDAGGLITNSKGGAMIDRRWNVSPTTQPTGSVGVKYFFTESEYQALKDTLANHNGGADPTTITAVTELNMFKIVNNATFQDPHANGINGIVLTNDATTPSTTKWVHAAYSTDHEAEFKVTSFSGGGGGGGGGNSPLPVELINFTATPIADHDAKLEWATASETNNSHFVIERSYDGRNFEEIDRVEGHGNSNEVLVYNYIDNTIDAIQNTVYYRLHQFDFDGESEYTVVRDVNFNQLNGLNNVTIFPNPFRNEVFISTNNLEANSYTVSVTAMNGAEVMHLEVNDNLELQKLDMTELSDGMYILNIITERASQNFRIIKN
jgi:predicted outer membrane repeat protein